MDGWMDGMDETDQNCVDVVSDVFDVVSYVWMSFLMFSSIGVCWDICVCVCAGTWYLVCLVFLISDKHHHISYHNDCRLYMQFC
jgi:hypothetical protein